MTSTLRSRCGGSPVSGRARPLPFCLAVRRGGEIWRISSSLSSEMTIGVWFLGCFVTGLWIVTDALRFREFDIVVGAERVMRVITIAFRIGTCYRSRQQRQTLTGSSLTLILIFRFSPRHLPPVHAFIVGSALLSSNRIFRPSTKPLDLLRPENNRTYPLIISILHQWYHPHLSFPQRSFQI